MTNFDANIVITSNYKYFQYKTVILQNTFTQPAPNAANGILVNIKIAVSLKYLIRYGDLLKKYCVIERLHNWKTSPRLILLCCPLLQVQFV